MQDKKSLTLWWRSCLDGGSDIVSVTFAHNDSQYFDYGLMSLHSPLIIQDARPQVIDAPLTLIFST